MQIITPLPTDCYLACSGGIDSMMAYHFLKQSKRQVSCLFFHHGTEASDQAQSFLEKNVSHLMVGAISRKKQKGESPEKYFRDERYGFFAKFNDKPIVMCHHLNDVAETWIMSSLRGKPKLIPYKNKNIIRPFLMVKKIEIINYAEKHKISWCEDFTNKDVSIPRNRVRHNVLNELQIVYPGFLNMLKNKYGNNE